MFQRLWKSSEPIRIQMAAGFSAEEVRALADNLRRLAENLASSRARPSRKRQTRAFGQPCAVMTEQHTVVAMTSSTRNTQALPNLAWGGLLPAMKAGPLPADDEGDKKLAQTSPTVVTSRELL